MLNFSERPQPYLYAVAKYELANYVVEKMAG